VGDKTAIEWTDATWNPVTGCDRTSPGCDHCYALKMAARLKKMGSANYQNDGDPRTSGPGFGVTCHPHMLDQPLRWKRPRRIFVNSMSDLFHPDVPDEFIAQVFAVMALAPQHTFQILTKRPQRMATMLGHDYSTEEWRAFTTIVHDVMEDMGHREACYDMWPLPNVWLGVSIETDRYTFRADHLRATPAALRFISAEPLLGPLPSLDLTGIDWLIVGGESGPGALPMHPDWVRDLRDQCHDRHEACEIPDVPLPHSVGVPGGGRACACEYRSPVAFLFKQAGEVLAREWGCSARKGTNPDEWPAEFRVREYPDVR
jgi:protein gp37